MLEILFGSNNAKRILIFLFVNGKCYGAQLQRVLKSSLTPIQKALSRLEKGGIVVSYLEGKTRVYRFNPSFPLLLELEQLLKKAYTLFSAEEKKQYSLLVQDAYANALTLKERRSILMACWEQLKIVQKLTFNANTKSTEETGWNGRGRGEVTISKEGEGSLIFNEKGSWQNREGRSIDFSNVFRWTLDSSACLISLEHLRRGPNYPVFLFHLMPISNQSLSSVDSHLCEEDAYLGQLFFDAYSLRLNWRVIGPKKNEEIDYFYS